MAGQSPPRSKSPLTPLPRKTRKGLAMKLPIGYLFKRRRSPFYQVKFQLHSGEPVYKSTDETSKIPAARKADLIIEEYMLRLGKPKRPNIGGFIRLPDKTNPEDRGGEYWQHIVSNRAQPPVSARQISFERRSFRILPSTTSTISSRSRLRNGNVSDCRK